ncbi:MAG: divalent-cation tolerance protein CutA [Acidobacteriota bacterium]
MGAIVVVTTVGSEDQGIEIAQELIARRQAACVNILPGVRSIYRWKGKICRDGEYLLIVKTMADEYDAVAETILELHRYELPELLAFEISRGDDDFLAWIESSLDKTADFDDEADVEDYE